MSAPVYSFSITIDQQIRELYVTDSNKDGKFNFTEDGKALDKYHLANPRDRTPRAVTNRICRQDKLQEILLASFGLTASKLSGVDIEKFQQALEFEKSELHHFLHLDFWNVKAKIGTFQARLDELEIPEFKRELYSKTFRTKVIEVLERRTHWLVDQYYYSSHSKRITNLEDLRKIESLISSVKETFDINKHEISQLLVVRTLFADSAKTFLELASDPEKSIPDILEPLGIFESYRNESTFQKLLTEIEEHKPELTISYTIDPKDFETLILKSKIKIFERSPSIEKLDLFLEDLARSKMNHDVDSTKILTDLYTRLHQTYIIKNPSDIINTTSVAHYMRHTKRAYECLHKVYALLKYSTPPNDVPEPPSDELYASVRTKVLKGQFEWFVFETEHLPITKSYAPKDSNSFMVQDILNLIKNEPGAKDEILEIVTTNTMGTLDQLDQIIHEQASRGNIDDVYQFIQLRKSLQAIHKHVTEPLSYEQDRNGKITYFDIEHRSPYKDDKPIQELALAYERYVRTLNPETQTYEDIPKIVKRIEDLKKVASDLTNDSKSHIKDLIEILSSKMDQVIFRFFERTYDYIRLKILTQDEDYIDSTAHSGHLQELFYLYSQIDDYAEFKKRFGDFNEEIAHENLGGE